MDRLANVLIGFILAAIFTPLVRMVAVWQGWVSRPIEGRWRRRVTARYGGLALLGATVLPMLCFFEHTPTLIALLGGAILMFCWGAFDDFKNVSPQQKLLGQCLAALIPAGLLWRGDGWVTVTCGVAWAIILVNAFNLLDNMDGVSSLFAISAFLTIARAAHETHLIEVERLACLFGGAIGGFLIYNLHPAKIFMGDCGSLFIGFVLAWLSLKAASAKTLDIGFTGVLLGTWFAFPLFDTAFVVVTRRLRGVSIAQGGRDHLTHRLSRMGISEVWLPWLIAGGSLAIGLTASSLADTPWALAAWVGVIAASLGILGWLAHRRTPAVLLSESLSLVRGLIAQKRQLGIECLDLGLIGVAYVGSWWLVGRGSAQAFEVWWAGLPLALAIQMSILFFLGWYPGQRQTRRTWRCLLQSVTIGAVLLGAALSTHLGASLSLLYLTLAYAILVSGLVMLRWACVPGTHHLSIEN